MTQEPVISRGAPPKAVAIACGAYYKRPLDRFGKRFGPLVAYAGRYEVDKQYVGHVFMDFSKISQYKGILDRHVSNRLARRFRQRDLRFDVICPAPSGGVKLGESLRDRLKIDYVQPNKVVVKAATQTSREQTELRFDSGVDLTGKRVLIVEDVCNNFSTTRQYIEEIESRGGKVVAIACFLNRSPTIRTEFMLGVPDCAAMIPYPVIALWNEAIPEFRQDDPEVIGDICRGNVFWKPKEHWQELQRFMPKPASIG